MTDENLAESESTYQTDAVPPCRAEGDIDDECRWPNCACAVPEQANPKTLALSPAAYKELVAQSITALVADEKDESERELTDLLIEMLGRKPLTQSQAEVLLAYHKALMTGVLVP